MKRDRSDQLFDKAKHYIPGGVNSPVRAFRSVGGQPLFIAKGSGSKIWDVDGNEYIDYVCSWGPLILGHAYPDVVEAVERACRNGTSFGAPTELEVKLAELITQFIPSVELVRMVSSGTEAVMSAVRVARGYTGKEKIIKFEGCYHGHADSFLIAAGSGAATLGIPDSLGVTSGTASDTIVLPFNDLDMFAETVKTYADTIAAVVIEPVAANMGVVLPKAGFLEGIRKITSEYGILLVFDEVITGFRVALGGAQQFYNIVPDLTCLGKVIGGGLPVGAYGGKREIMEKVAPVGPVYQAGTLSGNPIAMAAGYTTLKVLSGRDFFQDLESRSASLEKGFRENTAQLGLEMQLNRIGSLFCAYFTNQEVSDYRSAKRSNIDKFVKYFWAMLERGIYIAPSQFEAGFVSAVHSDKDIEETIEANYEALKEVKSIWYSGH